MKILIIEDHKAIAAIYEKILRTGGHEVFTSHSPEDALRIIDNILFDFVYVDLMLPNMSGEELIQKIRTVPAYSQTPIVVTTNMGSGYNKAKLDSLGVKDILLKVKAGPKEILETANKYAPKPL